MAVQRPISIRLDDGSKAMLRVVPSSPGRDGWTRPGSTWLEQPLGKTKRGGAWVACFRLVPGPTGAPVVAEVRVFPDHERRSAGEWAIDDPYNIAAPDPSTLVPPAGMPAEILKSIRWSLVQASAARITNEWNGPPLASQGFRASEPRRGRPRDYQILAEAAVIYESAVARGAHAIEAVHNEMRLRSYETAKKRVEAARVVGLLSPAPGRGKQGGVASPAAHAADRKSKRKG